MKLIVTGANGYVGSEVIRQSLKLPQVSSVVAVSRKLVSPPAGTLPTRFESVVVPDYGTYPDHVRDTFRGADACIWTVGITPMVYGSLDSAQARKICVDNTLAGLQTMVKSSTNKPFRFLYMSGADAETDQTKINQNTFASMIIFYLLGTGFAALFVRLFIYPVILYFVDPKGLRKFESFSRLSPLTDLRHCYLSHTGKRSETLAAEHERRGGAILRIGPNALSLTIHKPSETSMVIRQSAQKIIKKPKRRLLSAAFATRNLAKWKFKVRYTTQRLLDAFDARCTAPLKPNTDPELEDLTVDFNNWINLWTIEAINYIALSSKMTLLDTGTDEVMAETSDGTLCPARYRQSQNHSAMVKSIFCWEYELYPWLRRISKVVPNKWKSYWVTSAPWGDVCYHQAKERLRRHQAGEELDDFFSCLMHDKNGIANELEWGEIVAEISAIIDAGAETTAIALAHLLQLLISHPTQLQKLRDEIASVMDEDNVIAPLEKVKDLPYLKACLDEGLRLIPPVSSGLPRRTPPEGANIMDTWIPGNTSVSMTIWSAHHNEDIYPESYAFKPERWLDPKERKRMESFFIPFSAGARGCIGRNISYLEQQIVVSTLVHRYDFAMPMKNFKVSRFEAFNLIMGQLPIKIWRR